MGDSLVNGHAVEYLFDPDLIEVNWMERKSKFKNDVSPSNPGENIIMRPLCMTDYDSGYMELLSQLTKTGDVSREDFTARFHSMLKCPGTYYITVLEDTTTNRVIGSGTLLIEQKFIHNTSLRGRIEDIVVLDEYRGKQLGKLLLETLTLLGKALKCYKITLECKDHLVNYYSQFGYNVDQGNNFMVQRFFT